MDSSNVSECVQTQLIINRMIGGDWTDLIGVQVVFGLINALIFFIGITANGSVLITVAWYRKRHKSARNILLINLILADLLLCWTSVLVTPFVAIEKNWNFGPILCRVVPLAQSASVIVISWSLTVITINRYIHIVDYSKAPLETKHASCLVVLIWCLGTSFNIPYVLAFRLVDGDHYDVPIPFCGHFCEEIGWPTDIHRRLYGGAVTMFQFLLPTAIITFCYGRILWIVRRDTITRNFDFSNSVTTQQLIRVTKRNKRLNKMLIGMITAFLVPWFPLTILNVIKDFSLTPEFIRNQEYFWSLTAHSVAMTTVIWNPLFFFWISQSQRNRNASQATTTAALGRLMTNNGRLGIHHRNSDISMKSLPQYYQTNSRLHTPTEMRPRAPSDTIVGQPLLNLYTTQTKSS